MIVACDNMLQPYNDKIPCLIHPVAISNCHFSFRDGKGKLLLLNSIFSGNRNKVNMGIIDIFDKQFIINAGRIPTDMDNSGGNGQGGNYHLLYLHWYFPEPVYIRVHPCKHAYWQKCNL